jgi:hypothetical protein
MFFLLERMIFKFDLVLHLQMGKMEIGNGRDNVREIFLKSNAMRINLNYSA